MFEFTTLVLATLGPVMAFLLSIVMFSIGKVVVDRWFPSESLLP